jgi:hypothetical protein
MSTRAKNNILEAVALQAKHDEYAKDPNHSCELCEPEPREYWIISEQVIQRGHAILATSVDDAKNQVLQGLDKGEELDAQPRTIKSCWDKDAGRFV